MSTQMLVLYVCVHECLVVFNSATLWTTACQAPLSMGFSRQEYWSGMLCPPPGELPNPRIEPTSLMSPALAGRFFTVMPPAKPLFLCLECNVHAHVFFGMPKPFLNIKA